MTQRNHRQSINTKTQKNSCKKIDPRIKALWLEALRSGLYDQNFKDEDEDEDDYLVEFFPQLRTIDNKWSPFGVLCNLHAIEHPEIAKDENDVGEYLGYMFIIPLKVREWAKIDCPPGKFDGVYVKKFDWCGKKMGSIADLARAGVPFFVIADIIEENL